MLLVHVGSVRSPALSWDDSLVCSLLLLPPLYSAHNNHQSLALPIRHIMALQQQPFNWPLLKFPARPNQASCSIGAQPVPESHGGIVGFSAALTAQLTVAPSQCRTHAALPIYLPNPPTVSAGLFTKSPRLLSRVHFQYLISNQDMV